MRQERPANPYRQDKGAMVDGGLFGPYDFAGPQVGHLARRHDGEDGPGLLASDIDRLVQQHYRDGYAAAERVAEVKLEAMRAQLADAFDEGAAAQDGLNTNEVYRAVWTRFSAEIHILLVEIEQAPKAHRERLLGDLRAAVDEFRADAYRAWSDGEDLDTVGPETRKRADERTELRRARRR